MQRTRRARLRQGALSWGLFRDTAQPGRYVEYFVDENWVEHQRRLERFTAADAELRGASPGLPRRRSPPLVRRYVAERSFRRPRMLRDCARRPGSSALMAAAILPPTPFCENSP
jgi:hypothetical protein